MVILVSLLRADAVARCDQRKEELSTLKRWRSAARGCLGEREGRRGHVPLMCCMPMSMSEVMMEGAEASVDAAGRWYSRTRLRQPCG